MIPTRRHTRGPPLQSRTRINNAKRHLYRVSVSYPAVLPLSTFVIGIVAGFLLNLLIMSRKSALTSSAYQTSSILMTTEIIPQDFLLRKTNGHSFAFVFTTGRSGTQHLARVLRSSSSPKAYITHEEEDENERTRDVVEYEYRRIADMKSEQSFNSSMRRYIKHKKLVFYENLLKKHNARHLVYTGHVPCAFGVLPALIQLFPLGSVRVLRLRRERVSTALSLMALGPEEEDPWGATNGGKHNAPRLQRRWFPTPLNVHTRLQITPEVWERLNRFQRWLWYVDDIECRWQSLRFGARGQFSFAEESLETLHAFDNGTAWERLAQFMGTNVDRASMFTRHNSIQRKNRTKEAASEGELRQWDEDYRDAVGPCRLADGIYFQ